MSGRHRDSRFTDAKPTCKEPPGYQVQNETLFLTSLAPKTFASCYVPQKSPPGVLSVWREVGWLWEDPNFTEGPPSVPPPLPLSSLYTPQWPLSYRTLIRIKPERLSFSQTSTHPAAAVGVVQPVREKSWNHHHRGTWKQRTAMRHEHNQGISSLGPPLRPEQGRGGGSPPSASVSASGALLRQVPS